MGLEYSWLFIMSRFSGVARLCGPQFNSKFGALGCEAWRTEARSPEIWGLRSGWDFGKGQRVPHQLGAWGNCKLPQRGLGELGEAVAAKSFDAFLCSQMTSPAMENRVCTVQVYHFAHFCHACKSDYSSGPSVARGPGSLNRLNPRFLCHRVD